MENINLGTKSIVVNSCQYRPVYLIQESDLAQPPSFVLQGKDVAQTVSDNLKRFYENSGTIENASIPKYESSKQSLPKKTDTAPVTNSIKLSSFLVPKNNTFQCASTGNNDVLKPIVTQTNGVAVKVSTIPQMTLNRKIVKEKKNGYVPKVGWLTKIKPKESIPNSKHTSVQLLKIGSTYRSINQLSDAQMKIVNQALKNIKDPEKVPVEPTYDPVTNTHFIYKIVSPKDLTVVGRNKVSTENSSNVLIGLKNKDPIITTNEDVKPHSEPKVTRSGRIVKTPKQIVPEEIKPKKKSSYITCFQCSLEFCSLYRLQRHYEIHHTPAKAHSNLFQCLLAIVKGSKEDESSNIFIEQLDNLIDKLKTLLPCLLKKIDGEEGKQCTIGEDVGRLFGMSPGRYNLNMEALDCVKNKDGFCKHNPPKINKFNSDLSKPSQLWLSKHNEEIANIENEDCARINAVDKRPASTKQNKIKKSNAKKIRLITENLDKLTEMENEHLANLNNTNEQSAVIIPPSNSLPILDDVQEALDYPSNPMEQEKLTDNETDCRLESKQIEQSENLKPKSIRSQFQSTHFDIRSSPIKSSDASFQKIRINPEKFNNYQIQILSNTSSNKPEQITQEALTQVSGLNLQEILNEVDQANKPGSGILNSELNFTNKNWTLTGTDESNDSFMKPNSLIEPALLHVKDVISNKCIVNNVVNQCETVSGNNLQSNQGQPELNFFDTLSSDCLSYHESEIRNNTVDFNLDLFSFSNA